MSRFRFRLERVKRVREVQAEIARLAWQEAEASARATEEAGQRMRKARGQAGSELAAGLEAGDFGPAAMIPGHEALDGMDRAAARLERNAHTLALQAQELRIPFEEKRRDVRGLERLREKRVTEHRQENLRNENAEMDEVATARASRPELSQWLSAIRARALHEASSDQSDA